MPPRTFLTALAIVLFPILDPAGAEDGDGRRYPQPETPPFWKGRVEEIEAAVKEVRRGAVEVIARSPGGRPIYLVAYGRRLDLERQANYNSAAGAGDPRFYARKPRGAPPIVFIAGPPHGHEVEGMVGLVNLLRVAETGKDLRGKEWPELRANVDRSRLLVVPVSNPDGRARCPYDSFSGIPVDEMTRIGQGTRRDGTLYGWPGVKARHPMKDDVGLLGAYFNDAGVNLMHDEFFAPMAEETKALLRVARDEAPDFVLNLHSHGSLPQVLATSYVPRYAKETSARFAARLAERFRRYGLPAGNPPPPAEDGEKYPPPSFNLTSALHHVSGAVSMLFECPHGLKEKEHCQVTHDQILDLELTLFDELLAFALETPRPETDAKAGAAPANEHFAAADGTPENPGTREAPWDLSSALGAAHPVAPGDVLWVRGGTYRGKLAVKLAGRDGAPIHVRGYPGERATILDSEVTVVEPAAYVWLHDLEIAGSVPQERRETKEAGSHPTGLPGGDGLNIYSGKGCKFLNLVIHDNVGGGVGWWTGSTDGEIHGCIIYGNGWRGPDRGHGHSIYAQNRESQKTISGCILSVPLDGSYTVHAYGSREAYVDNFRIEDNIVYEKGPFLVGGGRPSRGIRVLRNYLHGVDMRLGYGAENEDCEVRDNVIAGGKLSIEKFRKVVDEGNVRELPRERGVLIPNRYDPRRAHLAIFNGAGAREVSVAVAPFLKPGDAFRILDPKDVFGKPVLAGTCEGEQIRMPMASEFAAFVLVK